MTRLLISKNTEAKVIATMWEMGAESLNPDDFIALERVIENITNTRVIDRKTITMERAILNGKT